MALRFDTLSLSLGGRTVLDAISGTIPTGQVTVILGPNGAGKSSLLACLSGLRAPDAGRILLDERAIGDIPPAERGRLLGLLPQCAEIHWDVTVRVLVGMGRLPYRGQFRFGTPAEDADAVMRAMAMTDVAHLADRTAQRLSGGEQARVLLARVLAGEPRWLLADEPLSNLDPAHQLDALDRLSACAAAGAGVVLVLHDLTQAARIAANVMLMKAGRIIAAGPRDTVLTPDLLRETYGVEVYMGQDSSGAPLIMPVARADGGAAASA